MANAKYTSSDVIRFWSKINKNGNIPLHCPELGHCWEWQASLRNGYGQINIQKKTTYAHHFSWQISNGEVLNGLQVLHKCDNKRCCNPDHLFLGTQLQNMRDKHTKGRQAPGEITACKGEAHGCHKLTNQQVKDIRNRYSLGDISQSSIAREIGVSLTTINRIVRYKKWTHLK